MYGLVLGNGLGRKQDTDEALKVLQKLVLLPVMTLLLVKQLERQKK